MSGIKRAERESAYEWMAGRGMLQTQSRRRNPGRGGRRMGHPPPTLTPLRHTQKVPPKKREPCYTAGGNVSSCSHYGEQYGGSFKN